MAFNRERALAAAAKYAARGQHDRAAREYQAIVEADPSDIRSWVMLADCLVRAGDTNGAIDRFRKVADFYAENDEPTKAIAVYRQILNLDAGRLDVHVKIAELLQTIGRTTDAIATYEFVAQSYFQAGKVAEGLEGFRMVAELDAGAVAKRLRVAELYSREGRKDEAVEHFRLAAQRLLAKNRYDDYIRVGERLLFHKDDDADILRSLAELYLVHAKEPRRALMKLNGLLRVVPNDPLGLELLADTFVALGKQDKAVSVAFELAKEQRKGDLQAKEAAARIAKKALGWKPAKPDELSKLLHDVEAEIKVLRAGEPEVLIDVADDYEEDDLDLDLDVEIDEGGDDFAVEDEDEIGDDGYDVSLSETDKVLLETRVYVRYKMFEHALIHVERLDALEPGNLDGIELRAEIYDRMGSLREAADLFVRLAQMVGESDPARAEQYLDQAVALVPDHPQATMMLSALEAVGRGGSPRPKKIAQAKPAAEKTPAPAKAPVESAPPKSSGKTPLPSLLPKGGGKTPLPSLLPKREGKTPLPSLPPRREPTPPPGPPPTDEGDSPVTTDDSGLLRFAAPKKRPPPPPGRGRRRTSDGRGRGRPGGDDDSSEGESEPSGATRREEVGEVEEVEELDGVELLEVDEIEAIDEEPAAEETAADASLAEETEAAEPEPEAAQAEPETEAASEPESEAGPEETEDEDSGASRRLPPLGFLPTRGRSTRRSRRRRKDKDKEKGLPKGLPSLALRRDAGAEEPEPVAEADEAEEATQVAAAPAEAPIDEQATVVGEAPADETDGDEETRVVASEEVAQTEEPSAEEEAEAAEPETAGEAEAEAVEAQAEAAAEPEVAEAEAGEAEAEEPEDESAQAEESAETEAEAEQAEEESGEAEAEQAEESAETEAEAAQAEEESGEAEEPAATEEPATTEEPEPAATEAAEAAQAGEAEEPAATDEAEAEQADEAAEAAEAAQAEEEAAQPEPEAATGEAEASEEADAIASLSEEEGAAEPVDADEAEGTEAAAAAPEPAADEPDISDELEELEFFISQGFDDDAAVAYMELVGRYPGHSALDPYTERFAATLETPAEEAAAPVLLDEEAVLPDSSGESGDSFEAPLFDFGENDEEDDFLSSIFDDDAPAVRKSKPAEPPRARAELEGQADARDLFDLGTAYREMGLIDDALTQFRMASKDPEWKAKSLVMMASLHLHRGEIPLAIADLEEAVAFAINDTEASEARYELGVIFQVMGEHAKAIAAFEQVHVGYRDRDERLTALLES